MTKIFLGKILLMKTKTDKKTPMTQEPLDRIKSADEKKPQPVNQDFIKRAEESVEKNQSNGKH
ncbi:hypothetical protein [Undibacterium squillarum]|uniref:hypothetical protein n=1 Tax=Undibacterium squillarum TaxID=1131567 RepID=UPI0035B3EEDF